MEKKTINEEEFLEIMSNYVSDIIGRKLTVKMELDVQYDTFSMSPLIKLYVKTFNRPVYLHDNNINTALNKYADSLGYALKGYKFMGGVRRMGMFVDEDTPYFDGIELYMIKKENVLKLKQSRLHN